MKKWTALIGGLILVAALGVFSLSRLLDVPLAAPIVLPDPADITSVDVTVGGAVQSHDDPAWIAAVLAGMSQAVPTDKPTVQDFPQVPAYMKIDMRFETGTGTLFAYEEGGKCYLEQPYQGIYELDRGLYERLQESP